MIQEWRNTVKPAFAQIIGGELVRLSTILPEFDGTTSNLKARSAANRVKANWYAVSSCPDPLSDSNGLAVVTFYDLGNKNAGAGTVTLKKV